MQKNINISKNRIRKNGGDYSSFATFEAVSQGDKDLVVGILSDETDIIKELQDYIKNRFYEAGPENLCLILESGLLIAYRKESKWVQIQDEDSYQSNLKPLEEEMLNDLIDDHLNRLFIKNETDDKQKSVDLILKTTFQTLAELIAEDINYLDYIEWRGLRENIR